MGRLRVARALGAHGEGRVARIITSIG